VKITILPSVGTLMDNSVAVSAGQYVSAADIAAGKLVFAPAANANGAGYASFTFQVQDDGGTANGGVDTDPTARTMTVNVTSVNDAPLGTSNTVTTVQNTAYVFKVADFGFSDPNDNPPNNLLAVKVTTLPSAGTLTDNGIAVSAGQHVSAADIAAGKLVLTPAANGSGSPYASFTFQVQDDGGTANGGIDTDPSPKTMTVNVTPVSPRQVAIDIKPGDPNNVINPDSHGTFEVAILSSADFNALAVNVFSLRFGRTGQEDSLKRIGGVPVFYYRDVNHDGRLDLVIVVETDRTGFRPGDTQGVLTGRLLDGTAFFGIDLVSITSRHHRRQGGDDDGGDDD
jgi:hypothetical protein